MAIEQVIQTLMRYEETLAELGKLQFRAHLAVPLLNDQTQESVLLKRNNRLRFQYQQLRQQRTQLLTQITGDVYVRAKAQRLKVINQEPQANAVEPQTQSEQLQALLVALQNEKLDESNAVVNQILAYLLQQAPLAFKKAFNSRVTPVTELMESRPFKLDLMMLNYLDVYFTEDELKRYVIFLIYRYTQQTVDGIVFYNARTVLPNAEAVGFSAVAYRFILNGQGQCFISYKGTEGSMENPQFSSFRQRFDTYVRENYQDWKYNIDAMLIGHPHNDEQLQLARRFTRYLVRRMAKIDPATKIYALGHSLGGHFVQTLQLLDQPFDAGYTLNAAPIQLKQIKHYRPDLFDEQTWRQLFELTKSDTQSPVIAQEMRQLVGPFAEIQNEWFVKDLTRIYFGFPYTFYIGTVRYLTTKNWDYPFIADITPYLDPTDLAFYSQFWGNLIHHLKRVENRNGSLMLAGLLTYGLQSLRDAYDAIKTPEAKAIFNDFARYLCDAHIFNDSPVAVQAHFEKELSKPRTALEVLKGEWPFLSSVNSEMVETVIYCHTISGAKYFK